jgi:hypothetical protein
LTVLIETGQLRWYVGAITLDGTAIPLMSSEPGNLNPYLGVPLDEKVSFLRHRFAGVLQRGCDRLWGRQQKPCQIVFVADGLFANAEPELSGRIAEHFAVWMTNPPVVYFERRDGFQSAEAAAIERVAGDLDDRSRHALAEGLASLCAATRDQAVWELVPTKPRES